MTEAVKPVINADGLLVDPATGLVVDDSPIDYGPEWRSFSEEQRWQRSRVGAPLTERMHDHGLTTFIDRDDEEASRLVAVQIRVTRHGQRRLLRVLRRLNRICEELGLEGFICEDAAWAARIVAKRVHTAESETAARAGILWSLARHGHEKYHLFHDYYLSKILQRAGILVRLEASRLALRNIVRYRMELGLPVLAELYASKIYHVYLGHMTSATRTLAATAVYLAAKLLDTTIPMTRVAGIAGITTASIRTTLKKSGIRILYLVDDTVVDEWWPGKDSYGARRPSEIATMLGIPRYSFTVDIPTSSNEPIKVIINER